MLRQVGIDFASDEEEAAWRGDVYNVRPVPGTPEIVGGSTWQSFARGSDSIETDYLNGEIALRAKQHGYAAPLNEKLQRITREAAASGTGVGAYSLDELAALLG